MQMGMILDSIEKAQINYLRDVSLSDYLWSDNYNSVRLVFDICGSKNKILDIGCGSGLMGRQLKNNGNDVYGIDVGKEQVIMCKKVGIKAKLARVQKIPFKSNQFDIVIMSEVIEHFIETQQGLKEVYRVLKKDGTLIITTPNFASFRDRILILFGHLQAFAQHLDHVKFFNKARLEKEITNAGFNVLRVHGSGFSIPIPKRAFTTFKLDKIVPTTLAQILILVAVKEE